MPARTGMRAHVDETTDRAQLEQVDELAAQSVTVSDGIDHCAHGRVHSEPIPITWPIPTLRRCDALAWFAATSSRPMLFSYQKSAPGGTSKKLRARATL